MHIMLMAPPTKRKWYTFKPNLLSKLERKKKNNGSTSSPREQQHYPRTALALWCQPHHKLNHQKNTPSLWTKCPSTWLPWCHLPMVLSLLPQNGPKWETWTIIPPVNQTHTCPKFDIQWGYNNIQIWKEDQWKAAFITPMGLFESTVMFFGFYNAPPMFQMFMNHIFADMLREKWLKIYMDDLGIHTKDDVALHHECTQWVLQCLQEHGLSIKLSKCIFNAPCMEFLGMIIRQGEIKMDKKLEAIKEWKPSTSVKGLQSFTGFTNFYRKFIPDFSNIVAPLNLLTCKGEPWIWMQLQQEAFKWLKHIFSSTPVLWIPDVTWPFFIMTDASLLAAGAVLMQADENSDLHSCAYFSCTFSSAQ